MKTATIPSLRVEPELRKAVEDVLREGETLSSFLIHALKDSIERRQTHQEFIDRGMASRAEAKRTNQYFGSSEVLSELHEMLAQAENE